MSEKMGRNGCALRDIPAKANRGVIETGSTDKYPEPLKKALMISGKVLQNKPIGINKTRHSFPPQYHFFSLTDCNGVSCPSLGVYLKNIKCNWTDGKFLKTH